MNVLILGRNGQVARSLVACAPSAANATALGRKDINICDPKELSQALASTAANWVINAAAYTAVDKAESEPQLAQQLNHDAAAVVASACATHGAKLIHLSTDFVFDGTQSHPYTPSDPTNPLNTYGQSKLAGEQAVLNQLDHAIVIRTSWVFSQYGNNFVKTMLRLMSEKEQLSVVCDQIGTPSSADDLATFIWQLIALNKPPEGLLHWTNAGVCSWYDFAIAIQSAGLATGLLTKKIPIEPVPSSAYPTAAKRPSYSVLDKQKTWASTPVSRHWQEALHDVINQLKICQS